AWSFKIPLLVAKLFLGFSHRVSGIVRHFTAVSRWIFRRGRWRPALFPAVALILAALKSLFQFLGAEFAVAVFVVLLNDFVSFFLNTVGVFAGKFNFSQLAHAPFG